MTNDTDYPNLISTLCRRTGRRCPAAVTLARRLADANSAAQDAVPDFEMTGVTRLNGCPLTCGAITKLSAQGVSVFCGVEPTADLAMLESFARSVLRDEAHSNGDLPDEPPLAMVLAGHLAPMAQRAPALRRC